MELKRYFFVFWKWLWMIVLSASMAAGLSYVATSQQPKLYRATTRLIVGQSVQSVNPNPQDFQTSSALALTYIEITKSTPVLQATIDALGIKIAPEDLRSRYGANLIPGTQLIELRVDDTDPTRAQVLANELAYQMTMQTPDARQDPKQREFLQRQTDDLQQKIEEGQKAIGDLRGSIQLTLGARDIAAKQQQISAMETQISQWQQTYTSLQQLSAPRSPNFLSVVEPAQLPSHPYAPNMLLSAVLGAAIGLIFSLGVVVVVEYFDDTLRHADDVTHALGLPILGTLALISGASGDAPSWIRAILPPPIANMFWRNGSHASEVTKQPAPPERIEAEDPVGKLSEKLVTIVASRSPNAEAYRVLRTNIQYNGVDKPIRSILVTSADVGEGKSLTAANLAAAMASSSFRTILVDCDLRKPSQHRLFGFVNNQGLTDSLMSQMSVNEYIRQSGFENLQVLPTGALPPNPAELLGSQRMRSLKKELGTLADILIFDGPPCLPVSDTAILANLVDGVLLVVDVTRTGRKDAQRAKEILTSVGARILGVALNRMVLRHSDYYYRYQYSSTGEKVRKRVSKSKAALHPTQTK